MNPNKKFYDHLMILNNPHGVAYFTKSHTSIGIAQGRIYNEDVLINILPAYQTWDFYICPNPSTRAGKPKISDVAGVKWFVLDFDPTTPNAEPHQIIDDLTGWLICQVGTPRYIIDSGRGLHAWFRVSSDLAPLDIHRRLATWTKYLASDFALNHVGWQLDTSCADISHVFRAPGSINQKTGRTCEIQVANTLSATLITTEQLKDWAPVTSASVGAHIYTPKPGVPLSSEFYISSLLNPSARRFIASGVNTKYCSRHTQAFAAAACLGELGVNSDVAAELIRKGASLCTPPLLDWSRPFLGGYTAGKARVTNG